MKAFFREVRPEAVDIGNVKNQSSPLDTGIAVFEVQNRASVFCAERCEIGAFATVDDTRVLRPLCRSERMPPCSQPEGLPQKSSQP